MDKVVVMIMDTIMTVVAFALALNVLIGLTSALLLIGTKIWKYWVI